MVDHDLVAPMEATTARSGLGDPPRLLFHCLFGLASLPLLWAFRVPGLSSPWLLVGVLLWAMAALVWLFQLVARLVMRRGWSWWFVAAPVMVFIFVGLVSADVPLKARWGLSRSSFEAAVARPAERALVGSTVRIGSYTITSTERVSAGVIFREVHPAVFGDAGFAYLPGGPTAMKDGPFEDLQWTPLGGPWYAWTASF